MRTILCVCVCVCELARGWTTFSLLIDCVEEEPSEVSHVASYKFPSSMVSLLMHKRLNHYGTTSTPL